jgi:hypothetical protein
MYVGLLVHDFYPVHVYAYTCTSGIAIRTRVRTYVLEYVAVSVVVVGVAVWVAAVVAATAVVEGEAMVVTSTLGWVMVTRSLSRTQWMQTQSVGNLGLLSSTCVLVFDVVTGYSTRVRTRVRTYVRTNKRQTQKPKCAQKHHR